MHSFAQKLKSFFRLRCYRAPCCYRPDMFCKRLRLIFTNIIQREILARLGDLEVESDLDDSRIYLESAKLPRAMPT